MGKAERKMRRNGGGGGVRAGFLEVLGEGYIHSHSGAGGPFVNNGFSGECAYQNEEGKGWKESLH